MNRRGFLRNAAGILVPAVGLLVPRLARSQILPPILAGGFNAGGGGGTSIALDGTEYSNGNTNSTSNTGFAVTTAGTNRLLVVLLNLSGGATPTGISVTGTGLTFAQKASQVDGTNGEYVYIYMAWASAQLSAVTVSASWTNSNSGWMTCCAFSGSKDMTALTAGTDFGVAGAKTTGATASCSLTTKVANSWIYGGLAQDFSTPGPTYTALASNGIRSQNNTPGNGFCTYYRTDEPLAIGTYTCGVTTSQTTTHWSVEATEILVGP